jgi:hypothetical protein
VNKAALRREMQRMLELPPGTVLSGRDRQIAGAVLAMHPSARDKIGPGITDIVIRAGLQARAREFHVIRVDGSEVDFSYLRALAPRTAASDRADVLAALRQEIAAQIVEFKRSQLERHPICAVSGVPLTPDAAHVDHIPPWTFAVLAGAWLEQRPLPKLESVGNRGRRLADRGQASDWQRFHRWAARLRLIHHDINAAIATCRRTAEAPAAT